MEMGGMDRWKDRQMDGQTSTLSSHQAKEWQANCRVSVILADGT